MFGIADPRRLRWDACYNVRDLGGFRTVDARETRWRAIIRADNLCRLTSQGRGALVRYGVRTVIDLRSRDELPLETDPFSRGDMEEVAYVNAPLMTDEFLARSAARFDRPFEIELLESCSSAVAALCTAISVAPVGGVLVYCHAGKERTGIAAALLLGLAGVGRDVIAAEYALSDYYLEPLHSAWLAAQPDQSSRVRLAKRLVLAPDRMVSVLGHLDARYGSVAGYLRSTGLAERDLARVRARLL